MKTKTNTQRLFWAGLLLCCPLAALAVPVTFQVNMEYQMTNATPTFTPPGDTVEVKGSFNGWTAGYAMANVPGTTIYTNTIEVAGTPGSTILYKFHTYGTHGDKWDDFYGNSYADTGGNRFFVLDSSAQTLPLFYFNNTWGGTTPLTVQVDMSAMIQANKFGSGQTVELKGAFNNWGPGYALTQISGNIYGLTFDTPYPAPGGQAAYKFHVYGGPDVWESDPNRILTMTNPATVMPVVCFNRACGAPMPVALLLQVDMSSQILAGNFDPAGSYQLWADGDNLGGWGDPPQGTQMFEDTSRPGIYTNTWTGQMSPGANFPFKFKIWNLATGSPTWENLYNNTNRSVAWQGNEPLDSNGNRLLTVGPVLFSNFRANTNDYLPADTWVTFTVDMTHAVGVTNNNPNGGIDWNDGFPHQVFVNGPFVNYTGVRNLWWGDGVKAFKQGTFDTPPPAYQMTNYPVGSQLYSVQVLLPKGSPVRVDYKYSIDGWDNEAAGANDHFREVRTLGTGNYVFATDTFGTQYQEPSYGNLSVGAVAAGTVPVSWLGLPGLHLQTTSDLSSGSWTDLYQTDGTNYTAGTASADGLVSLTNYPVGSAPAFFRWVKPGPSN